MIYSEKVMEHFQNPRNVGVLKDADGVGKVGNPVCGDMMSFSIKVKDNRIDEATSPNSGGEPANDAKPEDGKPSEPDSGAGDSESGK